MPPVNYKYEKRQKELEKKKKKAEKNRQKEIKKNIKPDEKVKSFHRIIVVRNRRNEISYWAKASTKLILFFIDAFVF